LPTANALRELAHTDWVGALHEIHILLIYGNGIGADCEVQ
jgi:hypothetical protein